jgi:acyl-CoA-dependent ceramide synthase
LRDIVFGIFMLSWFLARHVFYILNMYHIWVHMPETINIGCYHGPQDNLVANPTPLPEQGWLHMLEAFLNPSGTICYNNSILWGFLGALGFLQVLTVFWFFLILQVALRVVKGIGADDIRSDNEGGDKEGMEVGEVGAERSEFDGAQTLEFSVDAGKMKTWKRRTGFQGTASTSGVGFSGSRG